MNVDDVIYIALLLGCIAFGSIYRHLNNDRVNRKRWIGSAVGLLIVIIVSGFHVVHILLSFAVSTLIILAFDVRQAHILSFIFMFGYLLFFRMTEYFNIPAPPGHTNLIQMMVVLKMVGLAFERNTAAKDLILENRKTFTSDVDRSISEIKKAYLVDILDLNVEDVFHYCFNYVGILTGPYYSYRTFRDYFTARYWQFVNCELMMMQRLKWVAVYAAFFLSCSYIWPISYALSDEFYFERSFLYRLWYVWPSFFIFRMRIYIGLTLSECVCIMAGFGAYPQAFKSRPAGGPRDVVALETPIAGATFDFETIHNIDAETTEKCWTFKEAMRSYNMCVQYWMAVVVYQRFPNKKFRTIVTLAVSSFWHGVYSGYYMCMMGAPLYLPIENLWERLIRQKAVGLKRRIIDVIFWISKFFAFSYFGMAFLLMTIDKIWYYYQSVYHIGYITWIAMYVVGLLVAQQSKMSKREQRAATPAVPAAAAAAATRPAPPAAAPREATPLPAQEPPPPPPPAPAPEPAPPAPEPSPAPEPERPE